MTNSDPEKLTTERGKMHGDWNTQAATANKLKSIARRSANYHTMPEGKVEAIDMILTKVSRILNGDFSEPDHWDDIAGYAYLGKAGHKPAQPSYSAHPLAPRKPEEISSTLDVASPSVLKEQMLNSIYTGKTLPPVIDPDKAEDLDYGDQRSRF